MGAYYNEFKPEAAAMLRQLIKDGLIADGEVDSRSITEVKYDEIKGFTQCHFFAGIGGWSVALRLAGWGDERPVWTGSCPCQPFSQAGKGKAQNDERHLWPVWFDLIRQRMPARIYGEQVDKAISYGWLDGVYSDMEKEGYAIGAAVLPASSVNAPHKRYRAWFVAKCDGGGDPQEIGGNDHQAQGTAFSNGENVSIARKFGGAGDDVRLLGDRFMSGHEGHRRPDQESFSQGREGEERHITKTGFWGDYEWVVCTDGKIRRIPSTSSGIRVVDYGVQYRAPLLHAFGNAIVPEVAARFIKATM